MEKFILYSNDPYDFKDIKQIEDFYTARGKKDILKKLDESDKSKVFIKILVEKKTNNVEITLIQSRKDQSAKIKLPDLVLDYEEVTLKEVEQYFDLSEYMEFE